MGFKTKIGLILKGENRREGEKRRREEEEERRRKEEEEDGGSKRYGTMTMSKNSSKIWYESLVLYDYYLAKPRVLLGFHPNTIIMESKVDKTLNSTRSI